MAEKYTLLSGVTLSVAVKKKVKEIADDYNSLSGKTITITSGTRTAESQAAAMYGKLAGGDTLSVYRDQTSAQAIRKVYDDGIAATPPKARDVIISEIKTKIDGQIVTKKFISKHLKQGAVDVRSRNMTLEDKKHFKTAAKKVATTVILETTPPHFHLQF